MNTGTTKELWEVMEKAQDQNEKLLNILSRYSASKWDFFRRALPWAVIVGVELYVGIIGEYSPDAAINEAQTALLTWAGSDAIYSNALKKGDKVAGYVVTSPFGMRIHPIDGTRKMHKAVDINTQTGTQLYMLGTGPGTVECLSDPGGWGKYAKITPAGIPFTFQAAHLQNCRSGTFQPGEIYATTGNSGGSTGPHLDWGQYQEGVAIEPGEGFLWWTLLGNPPSSGGSLNDGIYGGHRFNAKQMQSARELIATAQQIGATSDRELVAMLMCAIQESSLKNLKGGDRDSKGYFQQRPSQGWNPSTVRSQVDGFFKGKGTNHGFWDLDKQGDLGATIQAVQKSAHPHEYTKWQDAAVEIVIEITK